MSASSGAGSKKEVLGVIRAFETVQEGKDNVIWTVGKLSAKMYLREYGEG